MVYSVILPSFLLFFIIFYSKSNFFNYICYNKTSERIKIYLICLFCILILELFSFVYTGAYEEGTIGDDLEIGLFYVNIFLFYKFPFCYIFKSNDLFIISLILNAIFYTFILIFILEIIKKVIKNKTVK